MNLRRDLSRSIGVAFDRASKEPGSWVLGALFGLALVVAGCAQATPAATCGEGLTSCNGTCINLNTSGSNCGACGAACTGGQVCNNGTCSSSCSGSTRMCGNGCADFTTDPTNCGGCGATCRSDQICNGACVCGPGKMQCSNGTCATSCATGAGGSTVTGAGGTTGGGVGGTSGGSGGTTGSTGGKTGSTGGMTGGSTGGAGGTTSGPPPGYYTQGAFHGCTWTGADNLTKGTTNTPADFTAQTPQAFPYCVKGTVGADPVNSATVALLGFNLAEPVTGAANQCGANVTATGTLPTITPTGTGIAVSYVRLTGSNIRVQIQDPMGTTDANHRWCATITQVQGPVFIPFSQFNTACYNNSGTAYAMQPISAVSLLVPGDKIPSPFSYCVGGFAFGTSASAAPAYNPTPYPTLMGTLGGPDPSGGKDIDLQRVKTAAPGVGGKAYMVFNNNWGNPSGSDQTINYVGNSFTVASWTGSAPGGGVPVSFPSLYIGANGQTPGLLPGVQATTPDGDGLPKVISSIGTLMSTFNWTPPTATPTGDYNATYDIWLAAPPPPAIGYGDALSGFVMVWLYKPGNHQPIGSQVGTASIGGRTWNVWAGPRGTGTNPNRPVISYVAQTPITGTTFSNQDLKPFLTDAATNAIIPTTPTNLHTSTAWLVTDVFAGFEIWTGGDGVGLKETAFTATVN